MERKTAGPCRKDCKAISSPTITVYLPRSLKKKIKIDDDQKLLCGWVYVASPRRDKIIIVVVGRITFKQATSHHLKAVSLDIGPALGIVGITGQEREAADSSNGQVQYDDSIRLELRLVLQKTSAWIYDDEKILPVITLLRVPFADADIRNTCAINVVMYTTPKAERLKYLSLEKISLPRASSAGILGHQGTQYKDMGSSMLQDKLHSITRLDPYRFRELNHSFERRQAPGDGFRNAIEYINASSYVQETLSNSFREASNGYHHTSSNRKESPWSLPYTVKTAKVCGKCARIPFTMSFRGMRLVNISAIALQLDLRLSQFIVWPEIGYLLRVQRRKGHEPVSNLAPRYIALYNGVWLVLNDLILGQAVGISICDNSELISRLILRYSSYMLHDNILATLNWLDNWPLGVKLNLQLSKFFHNLFVGLTSTWINTVIFALKNQQANILKRMVYGIGFFSRCLGLTMTISITIDLIRLFTLHCTVFYTIQQVVFKFFCTTIMSLFHLFRGKKRNPLRGNRIDQATYELDQLLLGTIFFTLLIFLWLTVAVYYLYFGLLRLVIVGCITILQTALAILNHLPLFALMLRLKEPDRLPAGVRLEYRPISQGSLNPLACSFYELHNVPLDLPGIFRGYNDHLQALRQLPILLWHLLVGRRI